MLSTSFYHIAMFKKTFLAVFILFMGIVAQAQTADDVYNRYLDFNLARLQGEQEKAMDLGEKILLDTAKLPQKVHTSFFNAMAKLYEDDSQSVKAVIYYKMVVAAQPDYYVAHRALGYLYIKDIAEKPDNEAMADAAYISKVKNALPHLEKAQACDPDDSTLSLIKMLYKNIKDVPDLNSLSIRLNKLKKNCVDILSDQ
jgi:tetratricopeptide (TPR) repeat protein